MKIIEAGFEILTPYVDIKTAPQVIERAGRTCYKSEDKIAKGTAGVFCRKLISRGHEAMLEHGPNISVRFTVDRGITHEMVRHRIASFAQESTRYCNYSKGKFDGELTFIKPLWMELTPEQYLVSRDNPEYDMLNSEERRWVALLQDIERDYKYLIKKGWKPQQARSVLPNSLKSEIVITANIREWRTIFRLRTAETAHPQIREVMVPLLKQLQEMVPCLFEDI